MIWGKEMSNFKKNPRKMRNYLQIKLASPQKVLEWTERLLPNNKKVGEVKKAMRLKNINKKDKVTTDRRKYLAIYSKMRYKRLGKTLIN
jgi:esterase/lipase superfamily enzyme